ncbi:MAG: HAMP domain-containing sensor histidine kinase [Devosia sp.]
MTPRSLRLRLLAGAALWIAAALVLAGLAIGYLFTVNVEDNVRASLSAGLTRLVALLDPAASPPGLTAPLPDPRYDSPASGVYWQIENVTTGAIGRSRSLFDFTLGPSLALPNDGQEHFVNIEGPDKQSLAAMIRVVSFEGSGNYRLTVAQNRAVLNDSIVRFGLQLTLALAILGVVLVAAALLQVRVGLGPLGALRSGIEAVRKGRSERLATDFPIEIQGLVAEVNELLAAQQQSVRFAQSRAADLAHGLKTPLAVLDTVATDLRARGDEKTAQSIELLASEMAERVDYQLRLSRLRLRPRTHELSADLGEAVSRTLAVVRRTLEGERVEVETDLAPLHVDIEPRDLVELVGVLVENAAKWAARKIEISSRVVDANARLRIADDGPGLTPEQIGQIGQRGQRLDEAVRGTGLGLAIANEIVALNGGAIAFGRGALGGLEVTVSLPLARG